MIDRQVGHMALLLDDLLDVARITRGHLALKKHATDLESIVDAAVETARPAIEAKRHRFVVDLPERPVRMDADPLRLAQALANLQLQGHEIAVVYDGESALDAFESFAPEIVLLDIGMPRLDGHDVARRIRAAPRGGDVMLIALTGWGQDSDKARAHDAGFDHHLTKPVAPEQLAELL